MTEYEDWDVLGLVRLNVPLPWWWHAEELLEPEAKGTVFRCYEDAANHELANLYVADVSNDPSEPNVASLSVEDAAKFDTGLAAFAAQTMVSEGHKLVRWMGSQLNHAPNRTGLVTAYIASDHGRDRQYIDLRIRIKQRNVIVGGCFTVARASELASPIFLAINSAAYIEAD